jgi:sulfopyruvate decarboxylase TPP-binding subunit
MPIGDTNQEAKPRVHHDLSFAQSGGRYRQATIDAVYNGLKAAKIDFIVYMPDATMDGVEQVVRERNEIESYQCVREDEGIAIAMGAYMVGRRPAVLMEASGIGMSGTILARSLIQRCPMLLIAGHCSTIGERYDYHASARLVAEPILRALNIPYAVALEPGQVETLLIEGQQTVKGQKTPFGLLLPTHVIRE